MEENKKGLYNKFAVFRTADGSPYEKECFILCLDEKCTDKRYLKACRKAILGLSYLLKDHLPELSMDLQRYKGDDLKSMVTIPEETYNELVNIKVKYDLEMSNKPLIQF